MRYLLCFISLLVYTGVYAQSSESEYVTPVDYDADRLLDDHVDIELFNRAVNYSAEIFGTMFNHSSYFVVNRRRGYDVGFNRSYFDNISLNDAFTQQPIWGMVSATRAISYINKTSYDTNGDIGFATPFAYGESYSAEPGLVSPNIRAWLRYGTTMHGTGGGYSIVGDLGHKWQGGVYMRFRGGQDHNIKSIEGCDSLTQATIQRELREGEHLSFSAMMDLDNRTKRLPITKLATTLTEDNLYNPAWGWQNGEHRNSRLANQNNTLFNVRYSGLLNKATFITASLSLGVRNQQNSALAWFDAMDPRPDYYRYMPEFVGNDYIDQEAAREWVNNSQIDWAELYGANNNGSARYIIEDRCEQITDIQAVVAMQSKLGLGVDLNYGIAARMQNGEYYKKVNDLLGAQSIEDIDRYLIDNTIYGNRLHNNTRDRSPKTEGDRFGYNYLLLSRSIEAYADMCYHTTKFNARLRIQGGNVDYRRDGKYEKELFPGNMSYGKSPSVEFNTFSTLAQVTYQPLTHHTLRLKAMYSSEAPRGSNIFISPQYRNNIVERKENIGIKGAELQYLFFGKSGSLRITGYYTQFDKISDISSYYDDLEGEFCNIMLYNISRRHYGAELWGQVRFNTVWDLQCIASIGSHTYSNNPSADIKQYNTDKSVVTQYEVEMKGYKVGNAAESTLAARLNYNKNLWIASISCTLADGRYVEPTANRRMRRIYAQFADDAMFREAVVQEKLPTAMTVDVFAQRSIKTKLGNYYSFFVSVSNLLNRKDNVYTAYEQMRVRKQTSGVNTRYTPMSTTYLYSNLRSFHCGLSYKFF